MQKKICIYATHRRNMYLVIYNHEFAFLSKSNMAYDFDRFRRLKKRISNDWDRDDFDRPWRIIMMFRHIMANVFDTWRTRNSLSDDSNREKHRAIQNQIHRSRRVRY